MWWQLVKVEERRMESGGGRDGERRERGGGGGVCRGGVCVVLGLVVGAMRVVSE